MFSTILCTIVCGLRGNQKRIIDGLKVTQLNRLPWVVGVYAYEVDVRYFWCTGALISNKHVLSSASCAYGLKKRRNSGNLFEIILGQINTVK